MYNYLETLGRSCINTLIVYLNRIQIGYSDLIVLALEKGWSEESIMADIENMVRKCFHDENVNVINNVNISEESEIEAYIKETSRRIYTYLKICNNY